MKVFQGTIQGFYGTWNSGIARIAIDDRTIPCDNEPTVRALQDLFGEVIQPGHVVDGEAICGHDVVYSVNDLGLLSGLLPAHQWDGDEIPEDGLEMGEGE